MNFAQTTMETQTPMPLIPGMTMEPGVDPVSPLGHLLGISSKLMDGLWFCPAIPPALCGELAATSAKHNRIKAASHLSLLTSVMRQGKWIKEIGCDIHFHKDGWLANGQHRLTSAKRANIPFYALIRTGLDDRAVGALDQGRKRSASDILTISFGSVENAKWRTAAAKALMQYESGNLSFNDPFNLYDIGAVAMSFSDEQLELIKLAVKCGKELRCTASVLAGICIVWQKKQPEAPKKFLQDVISGLTIDPTDPAYLFRQYMIAAMNSGRAGANGKRWERKAFAQMLIKAINLQTSGKKATRLQVDRTIVSDLIISPCIRNKNNHTGSLMDAAK